MTESQQPEDFAAQTARLLGAVQDWARRSFPVQTDGDGHLAGDCQWCPLCQFAAVLRGDRPEVTERVAEAGNAIASALRAVLDAAGGPAAPRPAPGTGRPASPRVQRIDLDDAGEATAAGSGLDPAGDGLTGPDQGPAR